MSTFPQTMVRYGAAMLATASAVLLRVWLIPAFGQTQYPLVTFYPAIMASAFFGGFGPGALATVLCSVAATWFMDLAAANRADWVGQVIFLITGASISILAESLHRQKRNAENSLAERKRA